MKKNTTSKFPPIETYKTLSAHKQLGFNIRAVRQIKNITQEGLGSAVGLTGRTIGYIETGYRRVEALELVDIALALNVKIEELIPS